MAIHLDTKVIVFQESYGKTLRIFDDTGVNDGVNNPDGFSDGVNGTDNPTKAECLQVILTITKGDLTASVTLTGTDLAKYLDPTEGYYINCSQLYGSAYEQFEDGIYSILATYSGDEIDGQADAWTAYDEIYSAFLWALWNKVRTLTIGVEVPIESYIDALSVCVTNLLMDSIVFLCQYGDIDNAEEVRIFLTNVIDNNSSLTEIFKNIKDYDKH